MRTVLAFNPKSGRYQEYDVDTRDVASFCDFLRRRGRTVCRVWSEPTYPYDA